MNIAIRDTYRRASKMLFFSFDQILFRILSVFFEVEDEDAYLSLVIFLLTLWSFLFQSKFNQNKNIDLIFFFFYTTEKRWWWGVYRFIYFSAFQSYNVIICKLPFISFPCWLLSFLCNQFNAHWYENFTWNLIKQWNINDQYQRPFFYFYFWFYRFSAF